MMPVICPTVLAESPQAYERQIKHVAHLSRRLQIDLTDGQFAKNHTIKADEAWWPVGMKADVHLMYKRPGEALSSLLKHYPHLIIVHAEAEGKFNDLLAVCRQKKAKVGMALLPGTPVDSILPALDKIDHVLIFSGKLGSYGGQADLSLLSKVKSLKSRRPELEIGWDGGVNDQNIAELVFGGVDVLNVGGYLQNSPDPIKAYKVLMRIAEETGST